MKEKHEPEIISLFPTLAYAFQGVPHPATCGRVAETVPESNSSMPAWTPLYRLVCAPAGYGKSTLYADWRNKLLLGSVKACWLSLEQEDNDTFQLLTYIAYSLFEGGVNFSGAGITEKFHFSDLSARTLLNIIQRVIEAADEKIVLIFDDFENLNEETIDKVIQPLLTYAPANLHIAVASRDDRRLKVAKLEMEGLALRLPARSLNFTADELRLFFEDYLPTETIGEIQRLTEGWPVAVQMLRSSVKADRDIDPRAGQYDLLFQCYYHLPFGADFPGPGQ